MVSPLSIRRLVESSAPVAVVLLVWSLVAELLPLPVLVDAARYAGLVMALLYVVVRGLRLGRSLPPTAPPTDVRGVLLDNARAALAAGVWFGAALLLDLLLVVVDAVLGGGPGSPFDAVFFALAGTGVATVLLYALANGSARVGSPLPERRGRGARGD